MKYFILIISVLLIVSCSNGSKSNPIVNSSPVFTWVNGESSVDWPGIYGVRGIPTIENMPGGRTGSIAWSDISGNLWLFGGISSQSSKTVLNDLWKYESKSNLWVWMNGESTPNAPGIYGIKGLENNNNQPGNRYFSISWADNLGNLWLFGGVSFIYDNFSVLNDLWKYNIANNAWTWMGGESSPNQYGLYGISGVESIDNMPGSRSNAVSWVDISGNFWLFSGMGYANFGNVGYLNDVWKFNPKNNTWTWVNGESSIDGLGIYGIKGVANQENMPGGRQASARWLDNSGDVWLFGGEVYAGESVSGVINDLWKYTITDNTWTWISGESQINQPGTYGTKGVAGRNNIPGSRCITAAWHDAQNNLWLFGGFNDILDSPDGAFLNDLWKYNITTNSWTWVKGESTTNQPGIYGTMLVPGVNNLPGSRGGAEIWQNESSEVWLFGGAGFGATNSLGYLNDLWNIR